MFLSAVLVSQTCLVFHDLGGLEEWFEARYLVECSQTDLSSIFVIRLRLWVIRRKTAEVKCFLFSSHCIKCTHYQHDLPLLMLNLDHLAETVFVHPVALFPPPFLSLYFISTFSRKLHVFSHQLLLLWGL